MSVEGILREYLGYHDEDCHCDGGLVCRQCSADGALVKLTAQRDALARVLTNLLEERVRWCGTVGELELDRSEYEEALDALRGAGVRIADESPREARVDD